MRRVSLIFVVVTLFLCGKAQISSPDTAYTSPENRDMTFYNLRTGVKTFVTNDDWHLAVSVRPSVFPSNTLQGTTLRLNGSFGVTAYMILGFTADSFYSVVDTAGLASWQELNDSDTMLDRGALNYGYNISVFNYGWGVYSGPPNHNVVGNKVFVIELPDGSLKKFLVYQLERDTAWDFHLANLDNSDFQSIHVSKNDYDGKNFVYLNLLNYQIKNKEPLSADWDLQFLKYSAMDFTFGKSVPIVGVWVNKGVTVAERRGVEVADNNFSSLSFSNKLNTIGWDWKMLLTNQQNLAGKDLPVNGDSYRVEDSLTYFIQTLTGDLYKLYFTGYGGVSKGSVSFNLLSFNSTDIESDATEEANVLKLFPNPCGNSITLSDNNNGRIQIFDMNGRQVMEAEKNEKALVVNTSDFQSGIYFLSFVSNNMRAMKKFVVSR